MERKFPDWIEGFLAYTDNTEPSKLYRTWSAIATVGAALRRKCYLPWGSETFYPNMYIVLVGPPAARKGTAMKPARDFMTDLGITMSSDETSRQKLVDILVKSMTSENDVEAQTTIQHSSLTIISPELTVFLKDDPDMYPMLCDWYDCRSQYKYATLGRGEEKATNVWVHMFGATTPTSLQRSLPQEAFGTGIASRIVFVYSRDKEKIVIFPGGPQAMRDKLMIDLEQIDILKGHFTYVPEFIDAYTIWRMDSEKNPPFKEDKLLGYLQRRPTQLFKLCMILSASRSNSMIITVEDFTRATELLTWTEKTMPQTFYGIGSNPLGAIQARVMATLIQAKDGKMAGHELMDIYKDDVSHEQLGMILTTLSKTRFCSFDQDGNVKCLKGDKYASGANVKETLGEGTDLKIGPIIPGAG